MMGRRSSCPPKFMIRGASRFGMKNGSYHVIVDISAIRQYSEVCWGRIQILQGRLCEGFRCFLCPTRPKIPSAATAYR